MFPVVVIHSLFFHLFRVLLVFLLFCFYVVSVFVVSLLFVSPHFFLNH